jgi:hypothetical protein
MVYGSSSSLGDIASGLGPGLVIRAFSGKTQSIILSSTPSLLKSVAIPSFRSAVKTALDQILIHGDSVVTSTDLEDNLRDIDENWHLGQEDTLLWANAIRNEVPNLFTVTSVDSTSVRGGGRRLVIFQKKNIILIF